MRLSTLTFCATILLACEEDPLSSAPLPRDAGTSRPRDAGQDAPPDDAGAADAGTTNDAGAPRDGGPRDGGARDAGVHDGGARDGGPPRDGGCLHPPVVSACTSGFCSVPQGCAVMGSPANEPCRESYSTKETPHEVRLTHDFDVSETKVTRAHFVSVMGYDPRPGESCGDECPVTGISWHEASAFCNALSSVANLEACYDCTGTQGETACVLRAPFTGAGSLYDCGGYRLPTEAEWEYAYRAGTTTAFYNGPFVGMCFGADANADLIGWYSGNAGGQMHPVAQKAPNGFGLYDMAGDAYEWVHDAMTIDLSSAAVVDPVIEVPGADKVLRSAPYTNHAYHMRAAVREAFPADQRPINVSFRCVRSY